MRAAHHDAVPIRVHLWWGVAQVWNSAVFHPGSAAVDFRRMASFAVVADVQLCAFFDHVFAGFLFRRLGNRRNDDMRIGKRNLSAKLESVQTHRSTFRFRRGHGASWSE